MFEVFHYYQIINHKNHKFGRIEPNINLRSIFMYATPFVSTPSSSCVPFWKRPLIFPTPLPSPSFPALDEGESPSFYCLVCDELFPCDAKDDSVTAVLAHLQDCAHAKKVVTRFFHSINRDVV